jgi:hypothetical protein
MGGSVCVRACPILQQQKFNIAGVAVLDVVEGTYRYIKFCNLQSLTHHQQAQQ